MTGMSDEIRLGPQRGEVLISTRREGFAARAGHDLTIVAHRWSAEVTLIDGAAAGTRLSARIELDGLAVRDGTGGALPMTDGDRREINRQLHKILGTGSAVFTSDRVTPGPDGGGDIDGTLELHGRTRPLRLRVTRTAAHHYRGTATVRQTEHGIKPYSSFLGALKLRDAVEVTVEVDLGRDVDQVPDAVDPA